MVRQNLVKVVADEPAERDVDLGLTKGADSERRRGETQVASAEAQRPDQSPAGRCCLLEPLRSPTSDIRDLSPSRREAKRESRMGGLPTPQHALLFCRICGSSADLCE